MVVPESHSHVHIGVTLFSAKVKMTTTATDIKKHKKVYDSKQLYWF